MGKGHRIVWAIICMISVFSAGCSTVSKSVKGAAQGIAKGAKEGAKEDWKAIQKADVWAQENMW